MKGLISLASLLLLLAATNSKAQSIVCENKFNFDNPTVVANRVCPLGYTKIGEVNGSSGSRGIAGGATQIYQDMINRNEADRQARLARQAAAAEAQRQREYEAQQAAARRRQQAIRNSSLPESARCLSGAWLVKGSESARGSTLDISDDGKVYFNGAMLNGDSALLLANNTIDFTTDLGDGASFRARMQLIQNELDGSMAYIGVKKGFLKNTQLPPQIVEVRGERTNKAPIGCKNNQRIFRVRSNLEG